jgi:GNAT superfamily N-acetyltransferase
MTALLRTVNDHDFAEIGPLHYRSRAATYADILPPEALAFGSPAAMADWWTERWKWERDTHRCTVAIDDDAVVGFTYLGPSEEPGVMLLDAIHVDPVYVGSGVGRLLMIDALEHLGDRAVLWVLPENERARRFYERGGWVFDGTTREATMGGAMTQQMRYAYKS